MLTTNDRFVSRRLLPQLFAILLAGFIGACGGDVNRFKHVSQSQSEVSLPFYDFHELANYERNFKDIQPAGYFARLVRAIHAPRVEWVQDGSVARYRLILTQDRKVLGVVDPAVPPCFMSAGWEKTRPGRVAQITIQGFDAQGKMVAISRMFRVFVASPFDPAEAAKPRRSYREAALLAFDALDNWKFPGHDDSPMPGIHPILTTAVMINGKPQDVCFPSLHDPNYAAMVESMMKIADDELRPRLVRFMRSAGDHMLACRFTEPDWMYRGFVRGCCDMKGQTRVAVGAATDEKMTRLVEAAKNGYDGEALLKVYAVTGDRKYLDAAVEMAEGFVRTQQPDGSWPARADAKTGQVIAEYSACSGAVASFLDRLNKVKPDPRWTAARDRADTWMRQNPMRTYGWVTMFDDVPGAAPMDNPFAAPLSNFDLYPYMRYLCRRADGQATRETVAAIREQVQWADNHFTIYGPDPVLPFDPFYPVCAEQGDPTMFEKDHCWMPMDGHTANLGLAMASLYRLTGDKHWLAIARAAGNCLTQYQLNDGRTVTWMFDQATGTGSYFGAVITNHSFWPAGWAYSAWLWAELADLESAGR